MRVLRIFTILCSAFSLSIGHAYAIQIPLSDDSIDRYFQILEQYVLPLMVVSTIVLFCGYLASRIFHRTVSRRQDGAAGRRGRTRHAAGTEDGTEVFLRGLTATPPIDDREARREPKINQSHPLVERRAAQARANEAVDTEPTPAPTIGRAGPATPSLEPAPEAAETERDREAQPRTKTRRVPPLKAAFRRTRQKPPAPVETPVRSERETPEPPRSDDTAAEREERPRRVRPVEALRAAKPVPVPEPRPDAEETHREAPRLEQDAPAVAETPAQPDAPARNRRDEPPVSVVKALKTPSVSLAPAPAAPSVVPPAAAESAKARAGEIVDSLDYIASVLQQSSALVAERFKDKQGLSLEDVRTLAIGGYDEPQNVIEDLRMLGGDAAEEVVSAFAKVAGFNQVVRRLEQMAEAEPLDEGWNELIRSRISETIFAVGQVRKTLGVYRRAVKRPANAGHASENSEDSPFPVGRRRV